MGGLNNPADNFIKELLVDFDHIFRSRSSEFGCILTDFDICTRNGFLFNLGYRGPL
jgi:hypothetical protein